MTHNQPTLTICLKSYNTRDFVGDAIQSILNQVTSYDYKILIMEDGSTDGSIDFLQKFVAAHQDKAQLHINTKPRGNMTPGERISENICRAIDLADSDYFCFLDSDDFYISTLKFQTQIDILENEKFRDCSACVSGYMFTDEEGCLNTCRTYNAMIPSKRVVQFSAYDFLSAEGYYTFAAFMFRTECLKRAIEKLHTNSFGVDDVPLVWSALTEGNVVATPLITFAYRQRHNSLERTKEKVGSHQETSLALLMSIVNREYCDRRMKKAFVFNVLWAVYEYISKKEKFCNGTIQPFISYFRDIGGGCREFHGLILREDGSVKMPKSFPKRLLRLRRKLVWLKFFVKRNLIYR